MTPTELSDQITTLITKATEDIASGVASSQSGMYNRVLAIVKELSLHPNGTIKTTAANLKVLARLQSELRGVLVNDSYTSKVAGFLKTFPALATANNAYFTTLAEAFDPGRKLYSTVVTDAIEITANSLLESGLTENIIQPVKRVLQENITTGGMFTDLVDSLRVQIKGDPERLGVMERYVRQITTDSLNNFNGQYTQAITQDLKLDWFFYSGGVKANSRSYCKKRAGNYYHRKEVEESAKEKWAGKNPRTNSSNIFVLRAGFNCGHQYLPVLDSVVPEGDKRRAKEKGHIK